MELDSEHLPWLLVLQMDPRHIRRRATIRKRPDLVDNSSKVIRRLLRSPFHSAQATRAASETGSSDQFTTMRAETERCKLYRVYT
jgi:hypothetical protein